MSILNNQAAAKGSFDNNNSGVLFVNSRRTKKTHANLQGKAVVNNVEYWLNAWVRTGESLIQLVNKDTRDVIEGTLLPNPKKAKPNHPDYIIDFSEAGIKASGWTKKSAAGARFISIRFEQVQVSASADFETDDLGDDFWEVAEVAAEMKPAGSDDFDESIPF